MSKFVKLLSSAMIGGQVRTPAEGVFHLEDADADRLIDDKVAEDVTSDFTATQRKGVPVMVVTAFVPSSPDLAPAPHLSEVVPDAAAETTETPGAASDDAPATA